MTFISSFLICDLAKEKQITQNVAMFALGDMYKEIRDQAPVAEQSYFRYFRGSAKQRRKGNPQNSRKTDATRNIT